MLVGEEIREQLANTHHEVAGFFTGLEKGGLEALPLFAARAIPYGTIQKEVFDQLRNANIGVNVHYIPIHTQPYYQKLGFKDGDFPNSESYYIGAISLPLFHTMTLEQQDEVVSNLGRILM